MKVTAIRPPRLRTAETEEERKVTWTELFYDLVFVVAVAGLGARLLADPTFRGAAVFTGLFIPLWWAWAGFTFYADRYDTDDLGQRILAVAQMATIALMAASISGETQSLAVSRSAYVGARVILIVMYLRARRHVPATRQLVGGYVQGMSIAVVFWLVSVFVPEPYRYVLWAVGLIIDCLHPVPTPKDPGNGTPRCRPPPGAVRIVHRSWSWASRLPPSWPDSGTKAGWPVPWRPPSSRSW